MVASISKIYFKTLILFFVCANIVTPRITASTLIVKEIAFNKASTNTDNGTNLPSPDQKAAEFKMQLVDIKIKPVNPPPELVDIVPGILIVVPKHNSRIVGHVKIVNTETIYILSVEAYEGSSKAFARAIRPTSSQPGDNGYTLYTFDETTDLPGGRQYRITKVLFTVITDNVSITQTLTNFLDPISINVSDFAE